MRFCRVVKSICQGKQASCELIFRIFANWKWLFLRFVKPTFKGILLRVWKFFSIWGPENRFFTSRETHALCVPRLVLAYFLLLAVCKCDIVFIDGNWTDFSSSGMSLFVISRLVSYRLVSFLVWCLFSSHLLYFLVTSHVLSSLVSCLVSSRLLSRLV